MTTTTTPPAGGPGGGQGQDASACPSVECGGPGGPHGPRCDDRPVPGTNKTVGQIKGLGA